MDEQEPRVAELEGALMRIRSLLTFVEDDVEYASGIDCKEAVEIIDTLLPKRISTGEGDG